MEKEVRRQQNKWWKGSHSPFPRGDQCLSSSWGKDKPAPLKSLPFHSVAEHHGCSMLWNVSVVNLGYLSGCVPRSLFSLSACLAWGRVRGRGALPAEQTAQQKLNIGVLPPLLGYCNNFKLSKWHKLYRKYLVFCHGLLVSGRGCCHCNAGLSQSTVFCFIETSHAG